jgi:chemotaxis signal transduction protein
MKNVIVFTVEGARFAVELRWVREVITMGHVTPVPGAPSHVAGAINVRGVITPVIDLRVLDQQSARATHVQSAPATDGSPNERPAEPFEQSRGAVLLEVDDTMFALAMVKVDEVATAEESAHTLDNTCAGVVCEVLVDSKNRPVRLIDPPALVKLTLAQAQELAAGHPARGHGTEFDHRSRP